MSPTQDGTPWIVVIIVWLMFAGIFLLGLAFAGWYFHTAWTNTIAVCSIICTALSVGVNMWRSRK